jgi:hypothetical protein|tara:strand:- start:216 stop:467 length:252 start_codon:yes stop_codon:yes gene_type:complete
MLAQQEAYHQHLVNSVAPLLRRVSEPLLAVKHSVNGSLVVEHFGLVKSYFFGDGPQVLLVQVNSVAKPFDCSLKLLIVDFVKA